MHENEANEHDHDDQADSETSQEAEHRHDPTLLGKPVVNPPSLDLPGDPKVGWED